MIRRPPAWFPLSLNKKHNIRGATRKINFMKQKIDHTLDFSREGDFLVDFFKEDLFEGDFNDEHFLFTVNINLFHDRSAPSEYSVTKSKGKYKIQQINYHHKNVQFVE